MNAYLQVLAQLVESTPGQTWLEQTYFPFSDLKEPHARLHDLVFFEQNANGASGILWCLFDGYEDELLTLPFRLARYAQDGDLYSLTPWSLREASGDSNMYEALRRALHIQNPLPTEKGGFFSHRYAQGEPQLLALPIWSDTRNSCVRVDSLEAYKIFRSVDRKRPNNLEIEILEHLNEQNEFSNYPQLISVFELSSRELPNAHIGFSARYIQNQGTLWAYLAVKLQHARFPQAMQEGSGAISWRSTLETSEQLGRLLGEFHIAMTRQGQNDALGPMANTAQTRQKWFEVFQERLLSRLEEVLQTSHIVFGNSFQLSGAHNHCMQLLTKLSQMDHLGLLVTTHGNAHLGQILKSHDGLYLLDFEADPFDDPKFKSQKQSCLVDAASILLSLKYCWMTHERKSLSHVFVEFIDPESLFGQNVQTDLQTLNTPKTYHPNFAEIEETFLRFYKGTVLENSRSAELIPQISSDFETLLQGYYLLRLLKETLRDYQAGNPRARISLKILEEIFQN
jgi:hypothetical protein